jgi:hypothetical protein
VLIDAFNDVAVGDLTDGNIIYISSTLKNITIEAKAAKANKVQFDLNGVNYRNESNVPYALNGDPKGDFTPWPYTLGLHTLSVKAFNTTDGRVSPLYTISFTVAASKRRRTAVRRQGKETGR